MSARGGSRMDGPLLEGPSYGAEVDEAIQLLGWMKAEGLVTQDGAGKIKLRTKGRELRGVLNTIHDLTEGADA